MTDTTTPAELAVPHASLREAYYAYGRARGAGRDTEDTLARVVVAAVPGVVAAELRRLATLAGPGGMLHVEDLSARADELDPEGPR